VSGDSGGRFTEWKSRDYIREVLKDDESGRWEATGSSTPTAARQRRFGPTCHDAQPLAQPGPLAGGGAQVC